MPSKPAGPDDFDSFVDDFLANGEQNPPPAAPEPEPDPAKPPAWLKVVLSTTPLVPGHRIVRSLGLVVGRVVRGQGPLKTLKMAIGDTFGGRSATLERDFHSMEQECFRQLKVAANEKGANAVVGVHMQYGETSGEADLFYVVVSGTAVVCEPSEAHR